MESELLTVISNQGLAIGISVFLVWWVTTQVTAKLKTICDSQNNLCESQTKIAFAVDKILEKLN